MCLYIEKGGDGVKKSGITTFYRLTEEEKNALMEQCRRRMEEEALRDNGRIREILEELLGEETDRKEQAARTEKEKPQSFIGGFLKMFLEYLVVMAVGFAAAIIYTHPIYQWTEPISPRWITGEAGSLRVGYNYDGNLVGNQYTTYGEGEFVLSQFHLFGRNFPWATCFFPGGNSYYGFWDDDSFAPKGFGLCSYADSGEFQLWEFDAYEIGFWDFAENAEYITEDGTAYLYTGMFLSGEEHGYGVLEDAEGVRIYEGEFWDGQPGYGGVWFTEEEVGGTQEDSPEADTNG